jgi:hypothetical protein
VNANSSGSKGGITPADCGEKGSWESPEVVSVPVLVRAIMALAKATIAIEANIGQGKKILSRGSSYLRVCEAQMVLG